MREGTLPGVPRSVRWRTSPRACASSPLPLRGCDERERSQHRHLDTGQRIAGGRAHRFCSSGSAAAAAAGSAAASPAETLPPFGCAAAAASATPPPFAGADDLEDGAGFGCLFDSAFGRRFEPSAESSRARDCAGGKESLTPGGVSSRYVARLELRGRFLRRG